MQNSFWDFRRIGLWHRLVLDHDLEVDAAGYCSGSDRNPASSDVDSNVPGAKINVYKSLYVEIL